MPNSGHRYAAQLWLTRPRAVTDTLLSLLSQVCRPGNDAQDHMICSKLALSSQRSIAPHGRRGTWFHVCILTGSLGELCHVHVSDHYSRSPACPRRCLSHLCLLQLLDRVPRVPFVPSPEMLHEISSLISLELRGCAMSSTTVCLQSG